MDDTVFQQLVLEKLRRLDDKIDTMRTVFNVEISQHHQRVDKLENDLIRIDTERKTRYSTINELTDSNLNKRELVFGVLGAIGMVLGLVMGILL